MEGSCDGLLDRLTATERARTVGVSEVYPWCMARTNIDIDEEACAAVMRRYGCKTKRDAVNLALRQAARSMTLDEARAMEGTGWDGDLDQIRSGMGAPEP